MRAALPAVVLVVLLAGCTGRNDGDGFQPPTNVATYVPVPGLSAPPTAAPTPDAPPVGGRTLTLRELAAGTQPPLTQPGRVVLVDQGSWAAMWEQLRENATDPAPAVDFATESVLLALHGPAPNACYDIRITGAALVGDEVRANVTTYGPDPSAACADVVTYPWHAVAVDRAEARAAWDERSATGAPVAPDHWRNLGRVLRERRAGCIYSLSNFSH